MGIARSGVGWAVAKLGTLGLSFVSVLLFTRVMENPAKTLGTFQVFEMIGTLAVLVAGIGLSPALVKRVSEGGSTERILGTAIVLLIPPLSVVSAILYFGRDYVSSLVGVEQTVVIAAVALIWVLQGRSFVVSALSGSSRVGRSGVVSLVEIFVRSVVQIALVLVGLELFGLVAGALVGTAVAFGFGLYMVPIRIGSPRREEASSLLSFAKFSFFREFATKAYHNIDTAIISILLGNSAVGVYNVPFRIALVLQVFSSAVSTSSFPEISRYSEEGDYERVREILADAIVFSGIVAIPATVGIFLLAEQIVITLFTSAFASGATVAIIAVAIEIPSGFRGTLTSAVDGMDRPELTVRADVILVGINLLLDIMLIPQLGITGAAIASFVGVSVSTVYLGYLFVSELNMPLSVFHARPLVMEVVAALVMGVVVYWLRETLAFPQPWNVLFLVCSGVVIYSVVLPVISRDIRLRLSGIVRDFL